MTTINLEENEKKFIFKDVIFWINPNLGKEQCSKLSKILTKRGATPASQLQTTNQDQDFKLRGFAVGVPHGLQENIFRFAFEWNRNKENETPQNIQKEQNQYKFATHIISSDIYFPEYEAALSSDLNIVTPLWVEKSARFGKKQDEKCYSCDTDKKIFSGMVITASQIPSSDREALYGSVLAYGGQYRQNLVKDVTHLVLISGTGNKYDQVISNPKLKIKILLPHWFEQCINLGVLVDDRQYLFPDPQIFKMISLNQNTENKDSVEDNDEEKIPKLDSSLSAENIAEYLDNNDDQNNIGPDFLAENNDENLVLKNYNVALSLNLLSMVDSNFIEKMKQLIQGSGGNFIEPTRFDSEDNNTDQSVFWTPPEFQKIDILICQHRSGSDFEIATRLGKLVGSVVWIIKVIKFQKMHIPGKHIIDYPLPENQILKSNSNKNMTHGYTIALSGYSGSAREYLKRLIVSMGAEYAPQLSKNMHTHLIASNPNRIKFGNARLWNCHTVNHLWLERSILEAKELSVSHPSFTYWPPISEMTLGKIVGSFNGIRFSAIEQQLSPFVQNYNSLLEYSLDGENPNDILDDPLYESRKVKVIISEENKILALDYNNNTIDLNEHLNIYLFLILASGVNFFPDLETIKALDKKINLVSTQVSTLKNENENGMHEEKNLYPATENLDETINDTSDEDSDIKKSKNSQNDIKKLEKKDSVKDVSNINKKNTENSKKPKRKAAEYSSKVISEQMEAANIFEDEMGKVFKRRTLSGKSSNHKINNNQKNDTEKIENEQDESTIDNNTEKFGKKRKLQDDQLQNETKKSNTTKSQSPPKTLADQKVGRLSDQMDDKTKVKLLFTHGRPTDTEERAIRKMGGHFSSTTKTATHLVSSGIKRTSKFLEALSSGNIWIVSHQWLKDSLELKSWIDLSCEFPDESVIDLYKNREGLDSVDIIPSHTWWLDFGYGVDDQETELKYKFKLRNSFYRAREQPLFLGITVYLTPNVQPPIDTLRKIIEAGGGTIVSNLPNRKIRQLVDSTSFLTGKDESGTEKGNSNKLLIVSCEQDRNLWKQFLPSSQEENSSVNLKEMRRNENGSGEKHGAFVPVYSSEIILTGVLRQSLTDGVDEFMFLTNYKVQITEGLNKCGIVGSKDYSVYIFSGDENQVKIDMLEVRGGVENFKENTLTGSKVKIFTSHIDALQTLPQFNHIATSDMFSKDISVSIFVDEVLMWDLGFKPKCIDSDIQRFPDLTSIEEKTMFAQIVGILRDLLG
ncbi:hypothetical protein BB558_003694 [Smittium angustum]|uniref:BRCT domain-containing protein n=1 Tax=Smittium angustum TaxID=133377 RepID=A0A2U1J5L3_SMIAN|nr:hypothetical protein BB558_003694 [Smittium angustum]